VGPRGKLKFDKIGVWSEIKLDIIREYAKAYSTILAAQGSPPLYHVYIDAFAGAGKHQRKKTGEFVPGSPANALLVDPPFREYHFIDLISTRTEALRDLAGDRGDVQVHPGDCNRILLEDVFPTVRYEQYRRALCLLDPYGLHLNWEVIESAGKARSIEIFLNFPVMDMNMNVLWRNPEGVDPADLNRMNAFWGDESWRDVAYSSEGLLFDDPRKQDNATIAAAFRDRLKRIARFKQVPEPIPMRNNQGATVYYLFFASQNAAAMNIITDIFKKYRTRGVR
jgi:three-Cys-motif partner protein